MDDDLVYKKPRQGPNIGPALAPSVDSALPTLESLQEKQRSELIEMAQVRYGIKGSKVQINLTSIQINSVMTEAQIFKALLAAPESERADQILYALAKGDLSADIANQILASLALLGRFKKIKIEP